MVGHHSLSMKFSQKTRNPSHQLMNQTNIILRGKTVLQGGVFPYPPSQKLFDVRLDEVDIPLQVCEIFLTPLDM